jgi:hypothetical protein
LVKIVVRLVLVVAALAISAFVLVTVFDDLSLAEIADAVRSLNDAEILALASMWILWIACQGMQTASLIEHLPVRRGVVAFLGPTAVSSVIPGPSDLPVRYRMLTSWNLTRAEAGLAVAAGGIFSIGIKLVLPVIAAVGLVLAGAPIDSTLRTIVTVVLLVGVAIVLVGIVLGSERRTAWAGRTLQPIWSFTTRLLRRDDPEHLSQRLVAARAQALDALSGRWLIATWGTFLASATNLALLVMALRFVGVPDADLRWTQVFIVYALVQGLTVVPISAGNAGVSDLAYVGLLTAAAGQHWVNQVAAAVILYRVITWLLIIPVGLGAIGVWRVGLNRRRQPSSP